MLENKLKGLIRGAFRELLTAVRTLSSQAWDLVKSYPLYFALVIMGGYAVWDALTPVTMIASFQPPKSTLTFTGDIVADAVQDGLKSIRNEIEEERQDAGLRSSDTGLPDLRNMLIPKFWRVQPPPRFTVEIKGVSYERLLSILRASLHTETLISGDVIVEGNQFALVARASDAGPWESAMRPVSAAGLKQASRELAEQIIAAEDPTLAGVALLKDGQIDQGLAELNRAHRLKPADERLKLNLCMGFAANRRYREAIECYKEVLVALLQLGALLERKGDWRDAIHEYGIAAQMRPSYVEAHLKLAHALVHEGKPGQAFDEYHKVAKLSPFDLERGYSQMFANQWLANELRNLGNDTDAASAYQAAIHIKSDDSAAHCHLALIFARRGHLSQAVHEYAAALVPAKLEEFNDGECLVLVDHVLTEAVASGKPGNTTKAIAELRKTKQGSKLTAQSASLQNTPLALTDNTKVVEQAVLRTGQ